MKTKNELRKEYKERFLKLYNTKYDRSISGRRREKRDLTLFARFLMWLGVIDESYKYKHSYHNEWNRELDSVLKDIISQLNDEEIKCKHCGSKNLAPDPSMYYHDAETAWGGTLLCLDCAD